MKKQVVILILFLTPNLSSAAVLGNNFFQSILDQIFNKKVVQTSTTEKKANPTQREENMNIILANLTPKNDVTAGTQPSPPRYNNKIDEFFQRDNSRENLSKAQIQDAQKKLGVTADGIIGPKTTAKIEESLSKGQNINSLKLDRKSGSGKGDALDRMSGTNFCTRINGDKDGDGVKSCGTFYGDCKTITVKSNPETINLCRNCPDCQFIKGSCGTPLYFYKNNQNNAQRTANQNICAVALTKTKLIEIFGSASQSAYCNKTITICNGVSNCREFPVRDTGHSRSHVIDMTGCVFKQLGIVNDNTIVSGLTIIRSNNSKIQIVGTK